MNTPNYSVLLVDDDQDVLDSYMHLMSLAGLKAKPVCDPTMACQYLGPDWPGIVLLDMYMPQMHGLELLQRIKQIDERVPVIVITGHGDIPMAVDALKKGACEFIEKPINPAQLLEMVKEQLSFRQAFIEQKTAMVSSIDRSLIGHSAQLDHIRHCISQFALLNNHVVVWGETGTGRHLVAQLINDLNRQTGPRPLQISHEAGAEPEQLTEELNSSEHTCWLVDNLESMSEECQRVLAQAIIERERNDHPLQVIAILNHNPEQLIASTKLVPELYYVLNQGVIELPELRLRPDDVAVLFHHFLKLSCIKLAKKIPKVEPSYLAILRAHHWPGNVRELRNVAELYAVGIIKLTGKEKLYTQEEVQLPLDELVGDYEKGVIEDALFLHSGRVSEAASYLQVPRKKLYLRMKKHGIDKDSYKSR
ncbi:sigma-54-dependent Fis family transcriptional regulator [Vibrio sp. JPW-9-11-11]|uniref:sigma-54-dependent transcriptional regulator n=1 Tax=Vibrio sp. JPW-9-11-11 TaxID=1416532 RepID=UPI00159362BC|nr:sigma-54 dependent transcriptional regulator [Vibrio sp. JPW-9-11-11]NVD09000.1 sigma-54-dependent Fis family transcriptional regulator [Vibrio sp. JPW-9-11-11]